jgi:hypothetical protein
MAKDQAQMTIGAMGEATSVNTETIRPDLGRRAEATATEHAQSAAASR